MKMYKKPVIKTAEVGLVQMIAESIKGAAQGTNSISVQQETKIQAASKDFGEFASGYVFDETRW
ncbi:MAG: hypothetical protein MJZ20_07205 [Bacteroidaceae bacterium]|nr:hypothetical protein [Bacteroidaceae bacterium]